MWRAILLLAGCGRLGFDAREDAAVDAIDRCALESQPLGAFGQPVAMAFDSPTKSEDDPCPSDDGLELFFTSDRAGTLGQADMWRVRRAGTDEAWGPVEHVIELSSVDNENTPTLMPDGLTMYFVSTRAPAVNEDIFVTTRADQGSTWSTPELVEELESGSLDRAPSVFLDGLAMIFHSTRPGGPGSTDFWISRRASQTARWGTPEPLGPPNTSGGELRGWMSPCGLELYFQASDRDTTNMDFYVVRRGSIDEDFGPAMRIVELSDPVYDQDLRLTPNRRHAYFGSDRSGAGDLYEATR